MVIIYLFFGRFLLGMIENSISIISSDVFLKYKKKMVFCDG